MEKQNNYIHILKYTSLFGSVQMLSVLAGAARNKLVALLLGTSGMGLLALFTSTLKLVCDSTNLGISISAVREISDVYENGSVSVLHEKIGVFRQWGLFTSFLGAFVCIAFAPLLGKWVFSQEGYAWQIAMLAPTVALTTFSACEMAILKATRRLGDVAKSSAFITLSMLVVSIPVYYFMGNAGILLSLFLLALLQTCVTIKYSFRVCRMKLTLSFSVLRRNHGFLGIGVASVLAGMAGSGAELAIRAYVGHNGGVDVVGLYNAVYVLVFTYASLVFTAMETDYYPRLSSQVSLGDTFNGIVNSQIEVSLLLVSPMLILFLMCVPVLLPLLYSRDFSAAMPVLQIASLSVIGRAIYVPMEYISLSRGDSLTFLCVELGSCTVVLLSSLLGYMSWGLWGLGLGLSVASFIEVILVAAVCFVRYDYHFSSRLLKLVLLECTFCFLAFCVVAIVEPLLQCCCLLVVLLVANVCSAFVMSRDHIDVLAIVKNMLNRRISKD